MKKIYITFLILIFSTTVYADEQEDLFENFTKWLAKNEFTQSFPDLSGSGNTGCYVHYSSQVRFGQ